jgi:uncharacterized membrane protein YfcA
VGLLAGLLGIGGGLIIVPVVLALLQQVLHLPLDIAMPMSIATSLATIVFTGFSSFLSHYRLGNIEPKLLKQVTPGLILGAIAGVAVATALSGANLKMLFASLVLLIAIRMVFLPSVVSFLTLSFAAGSAAGLVTGLLSVIMGIGGGAILVPILTWLQINIKKAIGCAAFSGIILALFGSVGLAIAGWQLSDLPPFALGYVYLPALLGVSLTSILTTRFGATISTRMNTVKLKRIFAGLLVLISINLFFG